MVRINPPKLSVTQQAKLDASLPPLPLPFVIVADDRERQAGWKFLAMRGSAKEKHRPIAIQLEYRRIPTADYGLRYIERPNDLLPVLIERKSGDDFIGSLGGGHDRLRAEFERMRTVAEDGGMCCMIVEDSLDRIIAQMAFDGRRLSSESIIGIVASWPFKFSVPIYFAGSKDWAERLAFKILRNGWDKYGVQSDG